MAFCEKMMIQSLRALAHRFRVRMIARVPFAVFGQAHHYKELEIETDETSALVIATAMVSIGCVDVM